MPRQSPKRPAGFYESAIQEWRSEGILRGLTDQETVLLSAQFCGLAVAKSALSADGHVAMLDLAVRAMHTAYAGRMAVRAGVAISKDSAPGTRNRLGQAESPTG